MTKYFGKEFAVSGDKSTIPTSADFDGSVSYEEGFTEDYEGDLETDPNAKPVGRKEINGILNDITGAIRLSQSQGLYNFDSEFSVLIGGYPIGALLLSSDGETIWKNNIAGNKTDPDSSSSSGWGGINSKSIEQNNENLNSVINRILNVRELRLTDFGRYSAWPQGKVFSHKSIACVVYNSGTSHAANDFSVHMQKSNDGIEWGTPRELVSADTSWSGGNASFGVGSDGSNIWMILRHRGANYTHGTSKHSLMKSTDDGVTFNTVVDDILFIDDDGTVPVLYHDFAVLPNGNIAFGYHFVSGRVGILQIDVNTYELISSDIFTAEEMGNVSVYVEPTLLQVGSITIGFLRLETASTDFKYVKMWTSSDNCLSFETVDTDITTTQSPIPLTIYDGYIYSFWCGRYKSGTQNPVLYMGKLSTSNAMALNWPASTQEAIIEVPAPTTGGSSGSGVPGVCIRGDNIVIALSANQGGGDAYADIFAITINMSDKHSNNNILPPNLLIGSSPAFQPNVKHGTLNLKTIGSLSPRIRMDDISVFALDAGSSILQVGSYAAAMTQGLGLYTYNGGAQTPALYIHPYTDSYGGSTGVLDINRDLRLLQSGETVHLGVGARIRIAGTTSTVGESLIYHDSANGKIQIGSTSSGSDDLELVSYAAQGVRIKRSPEHSGAAVNLVLEDSDGNRGIIAAGGSIGGLAFSTPSTTQAVRISDDGHLLEGNERVFSGNYPPSSADLSSAESGWFKDESTGVITQWGRVIGTGQLSVTFPIAFPSACRGVALGQVYSSHDDQTGTARLTDWATTTGFNFYIGSAETGIYWIAKGF